MCRYYESFPSFSTETWFGELHSTSRVLISLRRGVGIPNVIRRRHKASCTGDIDSIKSCAGIFENHAQHGGSRSRSGFQRCSSITCGQFLHPGYHPDERHGPAERAARIKRLKPCAGLNETDKTVAQPDIARGIVFNLQCTYSTLRLGHSQLQDTDTLYSSEQYSNAPSI